MHTSVKLLANQWDENEAYTNDILDWYPKISECFEEPIELFNSIDKELSFRHYKNIVQKQSTIISF